MVDESRRHQLPVGCRIPFLYDLQIKAPYHCLVCIFRHDNLPKQLCILYRLTVYIGGELAMKMVLSMGSDVPWEQRLWQKAGVDAIL